jgi:hypothetical protein
MMNAMCLAVGVRCAARRNVVVSLALAFAMSLGTSVSAGVVHNEALDGDLSNDPFAPTEITLSLGVNSLLATSVFGDREYVALTIPVGMQLSQLILISYVGEDDTAFIAVQEGSTMTEPPTKTNPANLLGWTHFGPGAGNVGLDILPDIGTGFDAIGFVPPLSAGTYTFWIQQTGELPATYQFDFVVVPGPGAAALLAVGAVCGVRRRRRLL